MYVYMIHVQGSESKTINWSEYLTALFSSFLYQHYFFLLSYYIFPFSATEWGFIRSGVCSPQCGFKFKDYEATLEDEGLDSPQAKKSFKAVFPFFFFFLVSVL